DGDVMGTAARRPQGAGVSNREAAGLAMGAPRRGRPTPRPRRPLRIGRPPGHGGVADARPATARPADSGPGPVALDRRPRQSEFREAAAGIAAPGRERTAGRAGAAGGAGPEALAGSPRADQGTAGGRTHAARRGASRRPDRLPAQADRLSRSET